MPISIWKKLSLLELTPTPMTLELANRSVAYPIGVCEDVFVKVGKFHFPANFIVVDYDVDPRVPLILGEPFYITCEEYAQEMLGCSDSSKSGNPTPSSNPIITTSSPSLAPFEGGDFVLEEIKAYLTSDSIPPGIDDADFDPNDESLPKENVPEENFKIYSNPLFEFDEEYISSDINPLYNEVLEDIEDKDSYVSNLDEPALLITPLSDANEDECFDPRGDIDEIDTFLDIDVSTDIEDGYHDSEGDIFYLECLLNNDSIPNLPPREFLDRDPRSLEDEPDEDDLKNMVKVFDPRIHEKIISLTNVRFTFEDRHYFSLTFVIRIFLPYLTYSMDSSFLLSSGSEDTIFDPGISAFHFSSLKPVVSH
ncbi:retrovirus-related pol polyprotein from transposon TNT 1-94 [Tanacetum coccineum]